jgi:hypothetical protein
MRRRRIGWPQQNAATAARRACADPAASADADAGTTVHADPHTAAGHVQHRRISGVDRADVDARADRL